jgi:hypothetical protein
MDNDLISHGEGWTVHADDDCNWTITLHDWANGSIKIRFNTGSATFEHLDNKGADNEKRMA